MWSATVGHTLNAACAASVNWWTVTPAIAMVAATLTSPKIVGTNVGAAVGAWVGIAVGASVGVAVGPPVGVVVGDAVIAHVCPT